VAGRDAVEIRSWIVDVIGARRLGPATLSARVMHTPGMAAQHHVLNGAAIAYYQSINSNTSYMSGWSEIQGGAAIENNAALLKAARGLSLQQSPSDDKYGRTFLAVMTEYQIAPPLTLRGLLDWSWTDEPVDTLGIVSATGLTAVVRGREDFLGTEPPRRSRASACPSDYSAGNVTTWSTCASGRTRVPAARAADEGWEECTRWPEASPRQ
jgi:hypothetical protein